MKKLTINISFVETFKPMPIYIKFMKELLTNKKNFWDMRCIHVNENVNYLNYSTQL